MHGVQVVDLLVAVAGNGGRVDQALRDDDRIADGQRLQRLGQQRAHADGPRHLDLVIGQDVAGDLLHDLVEVRRSIEQAGLEQTVDDVVFSLLYPCALRAQRRYVLRIGWRRRRHP